MAEENRNYSQFKNRIQTLIDSENIDYLLKEMTWKPNIVLSMIDVSRGDSMNEVLSSELTGTVDAIPFLGFIYNDGRDEEADFLGKSKKLKRVHINNNIKMMQFYFGALIHYSNNILGFDNKHHNVGRIFLKKYLNYNDTRSIITPNSFVK